MKWLRSWQEEYIPERTLFRYRQGGSDW